MPSFASRSFWAASLAACVLAIAGCGGGGGGGGGGDAGSAPAPPAAPVPAPITITTAPSDVTLREGQSASLSVVASSALPLVYQWQRNGISIGGATSASLNTGALTLADTGVRYGVVMANASGANQSAVATVTVLAAAAAPVPVPVLQVAVGAPGQSILISTTVGGALPYNFQWLRNGQPIAGASGTSNAAQVSYRTPPQTLADHGSQYALAVNNADGTAQSASTTLSIAPPPRVAAGGAHSLARSSDGNSVWAWGDNSVGQLGSAAPAVQPQPQRVAGLPQVSAIAAGASHSLALAADGSVWAWGGNGSGALGDGTRTNRAAPQRVAGVADAVAVAAGGGRSFALRADGSVLGWGDNAGGALGLGTRVDALRPEPVGLGVAGFGGVVALAAGARHTLALRTDGRVFAFGEVAAPLPDGAAVQASPVLLEGLSTMAGISAGAGHSLAVDIGGKLRAWGLNASGQLGIGNTTAVAAPTLLTQTQDGAALLPALVAVAGDGYALAVPLSGPLLSWGNPDSGRLGNGPATAPVTRPTAQRPLGGAVSSVAAGRAHALAVLADGSVRAWGANASGQLGLGTAGAPRDMPATVPGLNLDAASAAGR